MKSRMRLSLAVAFLTSAGLAGAATSAAAVSDCERMSGEFVFSSLEFTSPTTAVGEGTATGDLTGTFHAHYFNIRQGPGGPTKADASHQITTADGVLVTSDRIRLMPQDEPGVVRANSQLRVVGETGIFAGATGLLHTFGNVNLGTLEGAIGFKGKVCFS